MKKIFAALLALASSVAFATTTVPVQLLNPAGSSSGQAIVSTGSSSAPAWGGVGVNGIASIAANTVLANATGSSASPTAFSMPSCSATGNALNWTTSTGFTCQAGLATLASPTFTGIPTAPTATAGASTTQLATTAFVTSSPTINTPTINGITNASNAPAGALGEYSSNSASSISLTTGTTANITSITLTAGDWDVSGAGGLQGAGGASITNAVAGISATSGTLGGLGTYFQILTTGLGANGGFIGALPVVRVNSGSVTVYCVAQAVFTSGTATGSCMIRARRVH